MAAATPVDPSFITYLLTPDLCDCFFIVGNKELGEPERFGVVKKMLLAHSEVLRSDMAIRELKSKKDVVVTDIYPDTFRNMLRFVYGYDNTPSLEFDEADNLLYVAEKYQMNKLKARLSTRLKILLNPKNICTLMNNPACYRVLELNSAITRILQNETDKILKSPYFLDMCVDGLVKLVEQEALSVPEIDVWRATVRWARYRAKTRNGVVVRRAIERPAKHIRVCTIEDAHFMNEVATSHILTGVEIAMVCSSKRYGAKQENLKYFSNELACRKRTTQISSLSFGFSYLAKFSSCVFFVLTKQHEIELLPFNCTPKPCPYSLVPSGLTYQLNCTINITRVTDYSHNTSTEEPETIVVSKKVEYGEVYTIPFRKEEKNIVLRPNNKYKVSLRFSENIPMYKIKVGATFANAHISVMLHHHLGHPKWDRRIDSCGLPTNVLYYRPLLLTPFVFPDSLFLLDNL